MIPSPLYPHARKVGRFEHGTNSWHAARRKGIGGSDSSVLLGTSSFKTPYELWRLKTARDQPEDAGPLARCGNLLEDAIRDHAFGGECLDGGKLGSLRSCAHPHLVANVDGIIEADGGAVLVEIKTAGNPWRGGKVPAYYVDQVQHYLLVTGLERAVVVCAEVKVDRKSIVEMIDAGSTTPELVVQHHCHIRRYALEADPAWQERYLPIAQDFWNRVESDTFEEVKYAF